MTNLVWCTWQPLVWFKHPSFSSPNHFAGCLRGRHPPPKYADYTDVFCLPGSAEELLERNGINNHPIDLVDDKQLPYGSIYSLGRVGPVELVWKNYTAAEALPTTKRVELFNAKEFAATALGNNDKAFVAWFRRPRMFIFLAKHKLPC